MTDYGVQPTGFVRKPLSVILAEIEAANITEFGPGLIQTSQSPMGQINGIFAEAVATLWEFGEDVYQSYDPDQAEGVRLDILGRMRLLNRAANEQDAQYRQAITNQGNARPDIQDLARAVAGVAGVTYSQVFVNDSNTATEDQLPENSVAVAVIGGGDDDLAEVIRRYIVPGVTSYGNYVISSSIDGYCRSLSIIRPVLSVVELNIRIRTFSDRLGCPPPSSQAVKEFIYQNLLTNLVNGQDITYHLIRSIVESEFSTVEVISFTGRKDGVDYNFPNGTIPVHFFELATVSLDDIVILANVE